MFNLKLLLIKFELAYMQGIAGLDCWIAQSGLQSNLVDWIVIDNPKSNLDFGLTIQFFCFNPSPKKIKLFFIKKSQAIFIQKNVWLLS
jgi:hypothetical protein